jgi:phosphoribosylformimino-5-aminoimidazole carboxamide ribotide isomerase
MQLLPAIDLLHGNVVRLRHGDFNDCTPYDFSALQLSKSYAEAGADWLHVVDLVASRDGDSADPEPLFKLLEAAPQNIQTGGGVRSGEDIRLRLKHGAKRVVVGTVCVSQPRRFIRWLDEFGADHIVSALDVAYDDNGVPWPRMHGWTEGGKRSLWDLLDELANQGLKHLLCTDISKDGAMQGPNLELYRELVEHYPDLDIQASGGVSGLSDLTHLKLTGATSAITGKALLEGCFTIREALGVLS